MKKRGKWQHRSLSCACVSPEAFSDFCHIEDAHGELKLRQPLWLRDMYRLHSATCVKNMAQKRHGKESSNENDIFHKDVE
uniref:Uncharacterized protein n=1 Tax=Piliocolobus tephrosceles TaxID=591936 RepID=A0A8C9HF82_9PRIM